MRFLRFSLFSNSAGIVLDELRIGTSFTLKHRGKPIATITGVRTSDLPAWTVTDCTRGAALRRLLREGGKVAVSRNGLVEAVIEGVKL